MSSRLRGSLLALTAMTLVCVWAAPAGAHTLTGTQATNYETQIFGVTPAARKIRVRVIDLGNRIELRNDSHHVVIVLGYQNEPYLRIGPDGAYRNDLSPASFLNKTTLLPGPVPKSYDATAAPQWRRIGNDVVRWHDHRTHWMSLSDPPVVQRDRGHRHVVISHWVVPLRIDGKPATLTGNVVWVPGPSPWPWIALAGAFALCAVLAGRFARHRLLFSLVLGAGCAIAIVLALGAWQYATASIPSRLVTIVYDIGAATLTAITIVAFMRRRNLFRISPLLLVAGLLLAIGSGLANVSMLFRSQLPTTLASGAARTLVAGAIGLGVGFVATGAMHLRHPRPATRSPRRSSTHAETMSHVR